MLTPAKQAKLALPLRPWQEGYDQGTTRSNQPCPYCYDTVEALAWTSGLIEGKANRT